MMTMAGFSLWQWLVLAQHELLLFAGFFFLIGALDEFAVDLVWIWLRITGRLRIPPVPDAATGADGDAIGAGLKGPCAVFIPAWQEDHVIGHTIRHALQAWTDPAVRLYVGCYGNDHRTIATVAQAAGLDSRVRLVIHDRAGPSTKADCLNRLYAALRSDELRQGVDARMVILHDAEDMVDPAALALCDDALDHAAFVQLPVVPMPQPHSRWIGSHYCEEFAEAHGKGMVVRDALRAAIPSAGVGCAVERSALGRLAAKRGGSEPFAAESLTEDYELGLGLSEMGLRTRFLRRRTQSGRLIATRAYFPNDIGASVRQKTRWVHGIAFQAWERMGWTSSVCESWMRMRDRRGPFAALVLSIGYVLLILTALSSLLIWFGQGEPIALTPLMEGLLAVNIAAFGWRIAARFAFTSREYGYLEGMRAVLRIPVTNIIAIMAGRRALVAYCRTLRGEPLVWDKTHHTIHPATRQPETAT